MRWQNSRTVWRMKEKVILDMKSELGRTQKKINTINVLRKVEGEKEKHVKNQKDIKERKYKYLKQAKKICTDKKSHQRGKKYNVREKILKTIIWEKNSWKNKDLKVYHERRYHFLTLATLRWPTWPVKLLDFKGKEKSLWPSRQKEQVPYKGMKIDYL